MKKLAYVLLGLSVLFVASCSKDSEVLDDTANLKTVDVEEKVFESIEGQFEIENCGNVLEKSFFGSAWVYIYNDEDFLYVKVKAIDDNVIVRLYMNIWNENDESKNENYDSFPYKKGESDLGPDFPNELTFKIPYDENWGGCMNLNIKIMLYRAGEQVAFWWLTNNDVFDRENHDNFIPYCWQECECLPYRTQTPGGWGAPANGYNPGTYRDYYFKTVFIEEREKNGLEPGLIVGGMKTLKLMSASEVEEFLPSGGKPAALTENYVYPGCLTLKNSFLSAVVALTLSVEFDAYDEEFSEAFSNLGDLEFKSGLGFDGMSVQDLLDEANKVLGGEISDHSLQQLNDIIDKINNYFVDGDWKGDGSLFDECHEYQENS